MDLDDYSNLGKVFYIINAIIFHFILKEINWFDNY